MQGGGVLYTLAAGRPGREKKDENVKTSAEQQLTLLACMIAEYTVYSLYN